MINEDRVKEMYAISEYEKYNEKHDRQMGQFFRGDYIWKELIKSFFTGTITYILFLGLWGLKNQEQISKYMNGASIVDNALVALLIYLVFMVVYLLVTYVVFEVKYANGRKHLKKYYGHLKHVNQMYKREEKLKL